MLHWHTWMPNFSVSTAFWKHNEVTTRMNLLRIGFKDITKTTQFFPGLNHLDIFEFWSIFNKDRFSLKCSWVCLWSDESVIWVELCEEIKDEPPNFGCCFDLPGMQNFSVATALWKNNDVTTMMNRFRIAFKEITEKTQFFPGVNPLDIFEFQFSKSLKCGKHDKSVIWVELCERIDNQPPNYGCCIDLPGMQNFSVSTAFWKHNEVTTRLDIDIELLV